MQHLTTDLLMEVAGPLDTPALTAALGPRRPFVLWPVARLGDFTLQVHLQGELDPHEVLHDLESGGWTVLGTRRRTA